MPTPSPAPSKQRLKLTLRPTAESIVRSGHPWIYSDSIRTQNREGEAGELAVIYDRRDKFLALGFYDPDSPLRVRVLHVGKAVTLDEAWWKQRLDETISRREGIADAQTNGLRLINGESDGWPGLVLDRYADTLVLKLYAAAWLERLDQLERMFVEGLKPARIVLRLSRNLQDSTGRMQPSREDGEILVGEPLEGVVTFLESGLKFESDVLKGQKTGFFLDQRENRRWVESFARGADVLNAFSFTGAFSLYAARGGARSVTDLDISQHALDAARRNRSLNLSDPGIAACEFRTIRDDAFAWLDCAVPGQFDLVIVDPPSLAKRESERAGAIRAYERLNIHALQLLRPGGTLLAASCSAHVSAEELFGAVRGAVRLSGRRFEELGTRFHAPDHLATFPEANYLKAIAFRESLTCKSGPEMAR